MYSVFYLALQRVTTLIGCNVDRMFPEPHCGSHRAC